MFEGQNQNQNSSAQPRAGSVAPRGVEDIFSGTDASAGTPLQEQPPAALVVPGPPTALASGRLKPLAASGGTATPGSQVSGQERVGFPFAKIFIIVLVSVGVIGAGAAAFTLLQRKLAAPLEGTPSLGQPQDTDGAAVEPGIQESPAPAPDGSAPGSGASGEVRDVNKILQDFQQGQIDRALNPIPQDPASLDTDQDGLSDAQEFAQGTNPRLVDSDNDGLSDWEESAIFGTNPLHVDSDGDSYLDGEEVQNGYNPLGPGKLLNFEKAKEGAE